MAHIFAMLVAAQAAASPLPAPADQAAPAPQDAQRDTGRLGAAQQGGGDIVVTARRRAETIQSVPIAMSVIGGEELGARGAFNVNRLQQQQPSLQFYSSNPRNSAINIRGLGAPFGLTNDGIEQGVGFYVDGVYIGRIGASTFASGVKLGGRVVMLSAPAVVFLPYSVPCGPRSVSICSTSTKSSVAEAIRL